MLSTEEFWSRKQFDASSNIGQWLIARQRIDMKYSYGGSPVTTWERELNHAPQSLQPEQESNNKLRCSRTPRSAPNSRPQSSTRSASRPRRSLSQHPNASNLGVTTT